MAGISQPPKSLRNYSLYQRFKAGGINQTQLAAEYDISQGRVWQIIKRERGYDQARKRLIRYWWINRVRIEDAQRDVWLTYYPTTDPRLDFFEPVAKEC